MIRKETYQISVGKITELFFKAKTSCSQIFSMIDCPVSVTRDKCDNSIVHMNNKKLDKFMSKCCFEPVVKLCTNLTIRQREMHFLFVFPIFFVNSTCVSVKTEKQDKERPEVER